MGCVVSSSVLVPISCVVDCVLRLVLCVSYNINIIRLNLNIIKVDLDNIDICPIHCIATLAYPVTVITITVTRSGNLGGIAAKFVYCIHYTWGGVSP